MTLHNLSKYNYGKEKWEKIIKDIHPLFNKAIAENDMKSIQKEFETVIQKFRISEKFKNINIGLNYTEWSPFYKLIDFLLKLNKNLKY